MAVIYRHLPLSEHQHTELFPTPLFTMKFAVGVITIWVGILAHAQPIFAAPEGLHMHTHTRKDQLIKPLQPECGWSSKVCYGYPINGPKKDWKCAE